MTTVPTDSAPGRCWVTKGEPRPSPTAPHGAHAKKAVRTEADEASTDSNRDVRGGCLDSGWQVGSERERKTPDSTRRQQCSGQTQLPSQRSRSSKTRVAGKTEIEEGWLFEMRHRMRPRACSLREPGSEDMESSVGENQVQFQHCTCFPEQPTPCSNPPPHAQGQKAWAELGPGVGSCFCSLPLIHYVLA